MRESRSGAAASDRLAHRQTIDHDHLDHLLVRATVRVGVVVWRGLRATEIERETKGLYIYIIYMYIHICI